MLNPIDYSISKFISFTDEDTLTAIREIAETKSFKNGATIETRGENIDHFYLIENGLVQLGINGIDGSTFNLARLGPGHTFGEAAFFLNKTARHDASAESDVVLLKLSRANVDHLMRHSVEFSKALIAVSCMRVQTTLAHIGDTLAMPLKARTAKQILSVSQSVGGCDIINLRQVDIAHSLGVSRVSIGKALKGLAADGFIKIGYGKLEILARQDLQNMVQNSQRQF